MKKASGLKSEKGSITLFVLVSMIFFLAIAMSAYISASNKMQGQNNELSEIKKGYEQKINDNDLQAMYESLVNKGKIEEDGYYVKTEKVIDEANASSTNPTVPKGFKTVDTDTSKWENTEGEGADKKLTDVNSGLVIEDRDGNQFVWVPVDGTNLKYYRHMYSNEKIDDSADFLQDTGNGNWTTYDYFKYQKHDKVYLDSVANYGGFYVARYEAGVPKDASFYASESNDNYVQSEKNVTTYTPVSKAKNQVWDNISQANAVTVSEKMYNSGAAKTHLIDGYAWDTITQWLSNCGYNITDCTSWGNYSNSSFTLNGLYIPITWANSMWNIGKYTNGEYTKKNNESIEIATGANENSKANNIYDLAGNVYEWTTETLTKTDSNTYAVLRGGSFLKKGSESPVNVRCCDGEINAYNCNIGFRVALYL